jgi:type II secretory pathway predicted ATPase ExeA
MFLDFYGLKEQPFGVTPDPRYLFLSASHREALASLFYGVKTGRGLLALIAPPGMGKTTLLYHFLEYLKRSTRTAYLFQTQCDSLGLLRYLLEDLRIDAPEHDFVVLHHKLNEVLIREARLGRRVVLVIDESQNLDDSVLETARLLSDFETPREKLLQIVFAGQPQLAEKLERPELAQLRQRICIMCRIEPLCATDVKAYVEHRLQIAGYKGDPLFTSAALDSIAECTQGIPRNINNVCFGALSLGCAVEAKRIDRDLIADAVSDLDVTFLAELHRQRRQPVVLPFNGPTEAPASQSGEAGSRSEVRFNVQARRDQTQIRPPDDFLEAITDLIKTRVPSGVGLHDIEIELVGQEFTAEASCTSAKQSIRQELAAVSDRQLSAGQPRLANQNTCSESIPVTPKLFRLYQSHSDSFSASSLLRPGPIRSAVIGTAFILVLLVANCFGQGVVNTGDRFSQLIRGKLPVGVLCVGFGPPWHRAAQFISTVDLKLSGARCLLAFRDALVIWDRRERETGIGTDSLGPRMGAERDRTHP